MTQLKNVSAAKSPVELHNARLHPQLLRAYHRTAYAAPGAQKRALKLGRTHHLPTAGASTWFWLTAHNPYSQPLSARINRLRNRRLAQWLRRRGYAVQPGEAAAWPTPGNSGWPPEPGFWVQGLTRAQLRALLRLWGQWAGLEAPAHGRLRLLKAKW